MLKKFYREQFPKNSDVVSVKLKEVTKEGNVYVELVEYENINGMILPNEISKWYVNPSKIFKSGKTYPCIVLGVDEKKKHIDLSYKKLSDELKQKHEKNFMYMDKIYNLGCDMLETYQEHSHEVDLMSAKIIVFENTIWEIFNKTQAKELKYEHVYHNLLEKPCELFLANKSLDENFVIMSLNDFTQRIKSSDIVVSTEFMLTVISENAIDKIKKILSNDLNIEKVKIEAISSPRYKLTVSGTTLENATNVLNKCLGIITRNADANDGDLTWDKNVVVVKDKTYTIVPINKSKKSNVYSDGDDVSENH